jgi:hypothetical protein
MASIPDVPIQNQNKEWSDDPSIMALSTKMSVVVSLVNELIVELHKIDGQVRALRRRPQKSDIIEFDLIA